ncbi:MAG: hypothetical protein Q7S80_01475 [bacterium]|nr:hypothetical protein [bacterium]
MVEKPAGASVQLITAHKELGMSTTEDGRILIPVIQLHPLTLEVIGTIAGYCDGETVTPSPVKNCWVYIRRNTDNGTFHLCAMATEQSPPDFKPLLIATDGDFGQACMAVSNFVRDALIVRHARKPDLTLCNSSLTRSMSLWKMTLEGANNDTAEVYFQFEIGEPELFSRFTIHRDGATVEQMRSLMGRTATALAKRLKGKRNYT